jgi:endonuclease YncB( thermonuclease family)
MLMTTELLRSASIENCHNRFCLPANKPILAKPVRVIDGDTIVCAIINNNFDNIISLINVRVYGINCPEARSKNEKERLAATAASKLTLRFLNYFRDDISLSESRELIYLIPVAYKKSSNTTFDSFGRLIAKVRQECLSYDLSEYLLSKGAAVVYKEEEWTDEKLDNLINY